MKQLRLFRKGGKVNVPQCHLLGSKFIDCALLETQPETQMSEKKTSIDIREGKNDMWKLEFTYDEDFIAQLKTVPHRDRSFDSSTNFWFIHDRHLPFVIESAKARFNQVTKIFRSEYGVVWLDCFTGVERVQKELF